MSAGERDTSARDPEGVHCLALSRQRRARINAAAAALERHAGHDQDPLALLLAAAELRSLAAHPDATGPAEPAAVDPQLLREALVRIADAESGIWGTIARDALDGGAATPAATATGDASARR
jgi:hypothetical protein